nr:DUF3322 domain-containing protein [Sporichthya sp.]
MDGRWTTPADVADKVRRRWEDGTLLRALAEDAPFPVQDLPLRGPRAGEIGENLDVVQRWIADLEAGARQGRRYELAYADIGGRDFGRNRIPARAVLTDYPQAWSLLGVAGTVEAFRRILELSAGIPPVRTWAAANPLTALASAPEWESVVSAYCWLDAARGSGRYLREIAAPGVDTKFVERHRPLLARLLGVDRSGPGFVAGLGLRAKPEALRLRFDAEALGLPGVLSEGTFRVDELRALSAVVRTAVIVENEVTSLGPDPTGRSRPVGQGFRGRPGRVTALAAGRRGPVLGRSRYPRLRDPRSAPRLVATDQVRADGSSDAGGTPRPLGPGSGPDGGPVDAPRCGRAVPLRRPGHRPLR